MAVDGIFFRGVTVKLSAVNLTIKTILIVIYNVFDDVHFVFSPVNTYIGMGRDEICGSRVTSSSEMCSSAEKRCRHIDGRAPSPPLREERNPIDFGLWDRRRNRRQRLNRRLGNDDAYGVIQVLHYLYMMTTTCIQEME